MHDEIVVACYDPSWPASFESEMRLIADAAGKLVAQIEHVGSTAVPGLGAKPIIDIMAAVKTLSDAEECIPLLATLDYEFRPPELVGIPERRYFRKFTNGVRSHHLHVVVKDGEFWKKHLAFRDYLRMHPETARDYFNLKVGLAQKFPNDRLAYTDAKTEFIESIVEKTLNDNS